MMKKLNDKYLRRFWFKSIINSGIGITAYSFDEAELILNETIKKHNLELNIVEVISDVDIRTLDQNHVVPNMNPPNLKGVWFSFSII
jgi:hypothetical protein